MSKIKEINEYAEEVEEDIILYDRYEDAIIGIAHRFGSDMIVAYDYDKVLESLAEILKQEGSNDPYIDALEFFNHNIIGSWVGDKTPIFIQTL